MQKRRSERSATLVGTPLSHTFTVQNFGNGDLTLTTLDPSALPAGFSLVSNVGATPLAPGASTTFVVQLDAWILLGFVAQGLFTMRFLVQWIASERAGRSVVPMAFWLFSIGGGILLLVYALYRKDVVFIAGQAFGVFVYLRNLYFVMRDRKVA